MHTINRRDTCIQLTGEASTLPLGYRGGGEASTLPLGYRGDF